MTGGLGVDVRSATADDTSACGIDGDVFARPTNLSFGGRAGVVGRVGVPSGTPKVVGGIREMGAEVLADEVPVTFDRRMDGRAGWVDELATMIPPDDASSPSKPSSSCAADTLGTRELHLIVVLPDMEEAPSSTPASSDCRTRDVDCLGGTVFEI